MLEREAATGRSGIIRLAKTVRDPVDNSYPEAGDNPNTYWIVFLTGKFERNPDEIEPQEGRYGPAAIPYSGDAEHREPTFIARQNPAAALCMAQNLLTGAGTFCAEGTILLVTFSNGYWWFSYCDGRPQICRFELGEDKPPELHQVTAYPLEYDPETETETPNLTEFLDLQDPDGKFRAIGYSSGIQGSRGEAALVDGRLVIVSMQSPALVISGAATEDVDSGEEEGSTIIGDIEILQSIGALYIVGESSGQVSVHYGPHILLNEGDRVSAHWDEANDVYELDAGSIDDHLVLATREVQSDPGALDEKITNDAKWISQSLTPNNQQLRIEHIGPHVHDPRQKRYDPDVRIFFEGGNLCVSYFEALIDSKGHFIGPNYYRTTKICLPQYECPESST